MCADSDTCRQDVDSDTCVHTWTWIVTHVDSDTRYFLQMCVFVCVCVDSDTSFLKEMCP